MRNKKSVNQADRLYRASSLWYPVMLAQERGAISEAKGAELLSITIDDYRRHREHTINTIMTAINNLPSPFVSLIESMLVPAGVSK